MKTIPAEAVERTLESLSRMSEPEIAQYMERLSERQPALMVYLMTLEPDLDLESGRPPAETSGQFFFAGLAVVAALLEHSPNHPMVTIEQIEAADDKNTALLTQLDEGAEMNFTTTVVDKLQNYNQAPLFAAAMQLLTADVTHEDEIGDDIAMAMLKIKALIDCLDGDAAPPSR
jgi:hypothetical protein